ncbi:MAG: hypothetical protein Kow0058_11680 [Roseovarius sp.]
MISSAALAADPMSTAAEAATARSLVLRVMKVSLPLVWVAVVVGLAAAYPVRPSGMVRRGHTVGGRGRIRADIAIPINDFVTVARLFRIS